MLERRDEITRRRTQAVITARGAGIRGLTVGGVDLVQRYDPGPAPLSAGTTLFPWPNRVEDGTWWWRGELQQLDITDPVSHCAINGFLEHTVLDVSHYDETSLELRAEIDRPPGYPFTVGFTIAYELRAEGIHVRHRVVNLGSEPAPVALGAHPYLVVGTEPLNDLVLTVPAPKRLPLDRRHLPGRPRDVSGSTFDLRAGVRVSDVPDHIAFANLAPTADRIRMTLSGRNQAVELWADPEFSWAQIYRTNEFPGPGGPIPAIAVEPMTAPANALRSGDGLRWLPPGADWAPSWGISLLPTQPAQDRSN